MAPSSVLIRKMLPTTMPNLVSWLLQALALQLILFPALAAARTAPPAQEKQPLGSLSSVGQVYVDNSVVPAESTVFTGDTIRTDDAATATFTVSGRGSLAIASRTQLVFAGSQQYLAELKSGVVVISSSSGPSGINVKAGNFVVVMVTQGEQTSATIENAPDGSFLISCMQGNVGVVPLEGPPNGVFIEAGQSATISPQGELSLAGPNAANTNPPASQNPANPPQGNSQVVKKSHTGWIILGIAGGGAAAAAAALAAGHHSSTVSESSP